MTQLTHETMASGLDAEVPAPGYPRTDVTPGIVHFGVGGFHRAHEAMYLDRLFTADPDAAATWGVCGVGLLPGDQRMRDALVPQDGLYTLTLRHPDGHVETRVIGSIVDYLYAPDDPEAVLERLADPSTKIVSLTITEGGYNFSPSTGEFDANAPSVRADLADPAHPTTVFGYVVEALARRRARGIEPFTVMSCDNVQGNGDMARRTFTAFARLRDADGSDSGLADWIESSTHFPNSMVDRITPSTSEAMRAEVAERTGIDDAWPVVAESFTQWVLEDSFSLGRPELDRVGVQLVDDVEPYELMKLRLLNGSHQALAYFGHLLGHEYVHDAAADPDLHALVRRYMDSEAQPTLPPVPGVDLEDYKDTLFERFTNRHVADTVARLAAESSDRIPKWIVPVVRERLERGEDVEACAAIIASWTRYAEGVDEAGAPIEVVDRLADELTEAALAGREDPLAFVRRADLFADIADHPGFTEPYLRAVDTLRARGARDLLQDLE